MIHQFVFTLMPLKLEISTHLLTGQKSGQVAQVMLFELQHAQSTKDTLESVSTTAAPFYYMACSLHFYIAHARARAGVK